MGPEFYHMWYMDRENQGILYVSTGSHITFSKTLIGYSGKIGWLEGMLQDRVVVPVESVFFGLNEESDFIAPGDCCRLLDVYFGKTSRLVLAPESTDKTYFDSLLRKFIIPGFLYSKEVGMITAMDIKTAKVGLLNNSDKKRDCPQIIPQPFSLPFDLSEVRVSNNE